jgi:hypothetical protein
VRRYAIIYLCEGLSETTTEQLQQVRKWVAKSAFTLPEPALVFQGHHPERRVAGQWVVTRGRRPALFDAIRQLEGGDALVAARPNCIAEATEAVAAVVHAVQAVDAVLVFADGADAKIPAVSAMVAHFHAFARSQKELAISTASRNQPARLVGVAYWRGGQVPFGYILDEDEHERPFLRPVAEEQAIVDVMWDLKEVERLSYRDVGKRLLELGHRPPKGGRSWQPNTVKRIVERRREEMAKQEALA